MSAPAGAGSKRDASVTVRTLIRGTFALSQLKPFVYLIKSLCPEVGHLGEFRDWDRVYSVAPEIKVNKNWIRTVLRSHLVAPGMPPSQPGQKAPPGKESFPAYSLLYMGPPDRRVAAPCEKRPVTTVGVGTGAEALLSYLGCSFAYEYVRKGVRYRTRAGYIIEVYIVEKLAHRHDPTTCEPLGSKEEQHGIVEIISEDGALPEDLAAFMQHLQPFVSLRPIVKRRP